jgi:hypothetical protein
MELCFEVYAKFRACNRAVRIALRIHHCTHTHAKPADFLDPRY